MQPKSMSLAQLCLLIALGSLAPPFADATRRGGLSLRAPETTSQVAGAASGTTPSTSDGGGLVAIRLERLPARKTHDGIAHADASFYVGNITVGQPPQLLQVIFDTGSGHVLLPHKVCKSVACLEHHQYSPWASSTARDVNTDGEQVQEGNRLAKGMANRSFATLEFTQADLGEGVAKGVLVRDHVCLSAGTVEHPGHQACADLALLAATEEDAMPFEAMPADGIIGLGLEGLAVSALSSFYARLMDSSHGMLPEFGISLGASGGVILFGGRAAVGGFGAPLEWFPVTHPEDGLWQVEISAVRVGNVIVDSCRGGCRGVLDSGSSHLGVQANRQESLRRALLPFGSSAGDCQGPDLQFDLPRGLTLTLPAADYTDATCTTQLGALDLKEPQFVGVYTFGTNVLRRYYTAFDWASAKVGFAPNAGSRSLHPVARSNNKVAATTDLLVF